MITVLFLIIHVSMINVSYWKKVKLNYSLNNVIDWNAYESTIQCWNIHYTASQCLMVNKSILS